MSIQHLQLLYQFNYWARDKVLTAATNLLPDQWAAPIRCDYGSLQGTLVHTLSAEWVWRVRCQERTSPESLLDIRDFPTPADLQAGWTVEQEKMSAYLSSLDDAQLEETISYRSTRGQPHADKLWHLLYHLMIHGSQHRAEAGAILTNFGHSPGDIDLLHFMREQRSWVSDRNREGRIE